MQWTYNDLTGVLWTLRCTVYERQYDNGITTIVERGTTNIGTYASYSCARQVQYERSAINAIRRDYGTFGVESLIITFAIIPHAVGAYSHNVTYSVDN